MSEKSSYSLPASAHQTTYWPIASGQADALVIAEHLQQADGLIVVITPDMPSAEALETAVRFFSGIEERTFATEDPAGQEPQILTLPDWETLPYDSFSPHQDIISQRITTLHALPAAKRGLLILPLSTALVRLPPTSFIRGGSLVIEVGQSLDLQSYRRELESAGYRATDTVMEHGEFAIRGSLLDIFPMGHHQPYRLDLFDNEVETIRVFDPESQRSTDKLNRIRLLPALEFPLNQKGIQTFKDNFNDHFPNAPRNTPIYQDVASGIASPGLEYYLRLFFEQTASIFDYLNTANSAIVFYDGLHEKSAHFWAELNNRYEDLRHDSRRPILKPSDIYLRTEEFFEQLKSFPRAQFRPLSSVPATSEHDISGQALPKTEEAPHSQSQPTTVRFSPLPDIAINARIADPLSALKTFLDGLPENTRTLICAESAGRQQVIEEIFRHHNLPPILVNSWHEATSTRESIALTSAPLTKGFIDAAEGLTIVAEADLYKDRVPQRRRRKKTQDTTENIVQSLTELRIGAPVVHIDHGIGKFQGLVSLDVDDQSQEFLLLEYANQAKLYVPVDSLHLISRYSGLDDELAPISKLGTDRWSNAKRQAAEKIKDTAAELLEVYARREVHPGFACKPPDAEYEAFAASFPFEETPDQMTAINAVIKDMTQPHPMDRLVCGDVGFGKTEVAMRAAFLAANSGRQVAMLVPTTLLAQQHYQSFCDRFSDTPMQIELISRFRTKSDIDKVTDKLASGKVDIIVGTHKLLQKGLEFKNLGLLIIDEEHRFGVQQKERVKALRANIDILTMTATPIPRTLNLSLQGVRDLSIIGTPPERRLAVKTFVREESNALRKEAILREILRGGQVFYLHNEVKSIERTARELEEMVPDARVAVAHGQMRERELEQVMSDFYHKRFNVLVCTTIIETGIDIPSANTIIMDRADLFGLAQLHQLRGRVGRSHHQAYAYLLTPPPKALTEDARKRLEAISQAQDLGAGFTLATHDLEIRGAGELLGQEQSGHIQNIGFSLYGQLLDAAVKAMREGDELDLNEPLHHACEINLRVPALIPDDYLGDVHQRLILYKRVSSAETPQALEDLQVEMIDRFGLLPPQIKNLFRQHYLRIKADNLAVIRIDLGIRGGFIEFANKTPVDPMILIQMIQSKPNEFRLDGGQKLRIKRSLEQNEERLEYAESLIDKLYRQTKKG